MVIAGLTKTYHIAEAGSVSQPTDTNDDTSHPCRESRVTRNKPSHPTIFFNHKSHFRMAGRKDCGTVAANGSGVAFHK